MLKRQLSWANCKTYEEADIVIVGIPDESHSHSNRKGTSKAPNTIRDVSNHNDVYSENGILSPAYTCSGKSTYQIFDFGNIKRNEIVDVYKKLYHDDKIPITLGGDHSITSKIINVQNTDRGLISLVYFDAHPDFLHSTTDFYGSVIYDILPRIDTESSVMIGIRSPEQEELDNLQQSKIPIITPFDIQRMGLENTINKVLSIVKDNVYISFDMDCLDPAFAPGVSVPVPFGLSSIDAVRLVKEIASKGAIGMDIMEVCPPFDIQNQTSHIASRLIGEAIASLKIMKKVSVRE